MDEIWKIAFAEAEVARSLGEVPIGCVIVDPQGQVVARAGNRVEIQSNACAHAEMIALRQAMKNKDNWRLEGYKLYVTLEPCPMCAGAILNSRIAEVHYAAPDERLGACGTTMDLLGQNPIHRKVQVFGGEHAQESISILQSFFQALRKRNKERKAQNRLNKSEV